METRTDYELLSQTIGKIEEAIEIVEEFDLGVDMDSRRWSDEVTLRHVHNLLSLACELTIRRRDNGEWRVKP